MGNNVDMIIFELQNRDGIALSMLPDVITSLRTANLAGRKY